MTNNLKHIKIKRFRKLIDVDIDIASRITVIAGHNGIGKSTILGLISNGSELKGYKSYFEKIYQSNFQEIFHLDEQTDYIKEHGRKYSVLLNYEYEQDTIYKYCTVTNHEGRLRVVPRNANDKGVQLNQNTHEIGPDAKVPIPTLYIGMSRVIPIGESDNKLYTLTSSSNVPEDDIKYMNNAYRNIIGNEALGNAKVSRQKLRHSTKRSIGPDFNDYPYRSISLGQDSLSTIITAVLSFRKLQREMGNDYKGGILVIDEIDACLHPSAQEKLIQVIDEASKHLKLQIICTTHSLTIIKEVLGRQIQTRQNPDDNNLYYNVVYIQNTIRPFIMNKPTYTKIKNDMFLRFNNYQDNSHEIKIYFEDEEALYFFNCLMKNTQGIERDGIRLTTISADISCDTLLKLPDKDSYFKSVLIIPDGDVKKRESYKKRIETNKNICSLPTNCSPEQVIHEYLDFLLQNFDHAYWKENQDTLHSQLVRDNMLNSIDEKLNDASDAKIRIRYKEWFNENKKHFDKTNIIQYWMNDNPKIVEDFISKFNTALNHIEAYYIKNN